MSAPAQRRVAGDAAYLAELKSLAALHARAQGIAPKRCAEVLERITSDGDDPSGWATVWTAEGDQQARARNAMAAVRAYTMARFPYVDGKMRAEALIRCTEWFAVWARKQGAVRLDVEAGGTVPVWVQRPPGVRRPLLLVMGGIVSIKEQWGPVLALAGRLGVAIAVTEMPGVGENTLRYGPESWRMIPAVLDALEEHADVTNTFVLALSFSGHMALRACGHDARVRGIATVGAPVRDFFTDHEWWARVPETTVRTLAHITGIDARELPERLPAWALSEEELAAITVPVHYVASSRDEIIPASDPAGVRQLPGAEVVTHDDVHGSPAHLAETRFWLMAAAAGALGLGRARVRVLRLLARLARRRA